MIPWCKVQSFALPPSTGDSSVGLSLAAICPPVPVFRVWELRGEEGGWELRGEEGGEKGEEEGGWELRGEEGGEEGGWELRGEEGAVTGRRGSMIAKWNFVERKKKKIQKRWFRESRKGDHD